MADIKNFIPKLLKVEGGFVNDPADAGGATNKGITLTTFRSFYGKTKTVVDLKKLTDKQAETIYKSLYWDKCKADEIKSQSVAEIFVDFAVNSGVLRAVKKMQTVLGVTADGKIGKITMGKLNNMPSKELFDKFKDMRVKYYRSLVEAKPSQAKFLKGWLKRLEVYKYES